MGNLNRGLTWMLPTKIQFIWPRGCRGEDVFEIDQSETGIAFGGHAY